MYFPLLHALVILLIFTMEVKVKRGNNLGQQNRKIPVILTHICGL